MITERFLGSSLTGSSGDANRTLTLGNTSKTDSNNFEVFINNSFLHLNVDYSVSHNTSGTVITFLSPSWDDQSISVVYLVISDSLKKVVNENYTGSDCDGSDGGADRNLTISNTSLTTQEGFLVYVNNSYLQLNIDYTVSHKTSGTIVTFLNPLFDSQNILIKYYSQTIPSSSAKGVLPLDTQLINNEINYFGDTVTIRSINKLDEDDRGNAQLVFGDSKIPYTSGDDDLLGFYDTEWIAQTFTPAISFNVTSIKLKIKRTGTPGAITVSIRSTSSDKPTGSDLTSGSLDYTDLISDGETGWIVIPLDDYTLSASTKYAIVVRTASGDSSNKYESRIKTTGTYSGGNSLTSSDSGSSWSSGTSDLLFEIFGDTNTVAMVDILTMDDDVVKYGQFQSGDIRLNFQNAESNITRGNRIKYRNSWFEIDSIEKDSLGDTNYFSECIAKKI